MEHRTKNLWLKARASGLAKALSQLYKPLPNGLKPDYELLSLEPGFDETAHGEYARLLIHELEKPRANAPRSIALTGPYGAGKSSVIQRVIEHVGPRAVTISLPTLGDAVAQEKRGSAGASPDRQMTKTNVVQKEIVKQLLYIERPSKMPGSRFQRITPMRWRLALAYAVAVATVSTVILFATDALASLVRLLPDPWLYAAAIHFAAWLFVFGLALMTQAAFHSRVTVEQLGSAAASIKLTNANTNFFDEYLDEIVYFFERTEVDIVIFEDLDRFNEPHIFEALKELNTLLNGSKQLNSKKCVRFVYALRDSVFDTGTEVGAGSERAKFFGAIVPLVPFITHKSSASLILETLGKSAPDSPHLVDTISAHLTDMRLIKNIRNEWELFRRRILNEDGLKDLSPVRLFAMVVFKNLYPGDFERIRSATSRLDILFRAGTATIEQNAARLSKEAAKLRARSRNPHAEQIAKDTGAKLHEYASRLGGIYGEQPPSTYTVGSRTYQPAQLETVQFWRDLAEHPPLGAIYQAVRNYNAVNLTANYTISDIEAGLGVKCDPDLWESESTDKLARQAEAREEEILSLESRSVADLLVEASYSVDVEPRDRARLTGDDLLPDGPIRFDRLVELLFPESLVHDLLLHELVDRNFTLYASEFRDARITASAMTYFLHHVQDGRANLTYRFSKPSDVDALIDYAGAPAINDRSFYNIEIIQRLLTEPRHSESLDNLLLVLGSATDEDRAFLRSFLDRSQSGSLLLEKLAAHDSRLFEWIVANFAADNIGRAVAYFSAALLGGSARPYHGDERVRIFVSENAHRMVALTEPVSAVASSTITSVLRRLDAKVPDLRVLPEPQRSDAMQRELFELNRTNLKVAARGAELSLDGLRETNPWLADLLVRNGTEYVDMIRTNEDLVAIQDETVMSATLNWVGESSPDLVEEIARLASPGAMIADLAEVGKPLQASVARAGRATPTVANIAELEARLEDGTASESDIEQFLAHFSQLEDDGSDADLSTRTRDRILKASLIANDDKATLIASLAAAPELTVEDLELDDSDLVARLVSVGVLRDDINTFTALTGWPTARAALMEYSSEFTNYVTSDVLDSDAVEAIALSPSISETVRRRILSLPRSLSRANRVAAKALVEFAKAERAPVQTSNLQYIASLGVPRADVVALVAFNIENRSGAALGSLFQLLGGEYADLASPGRGVIELPDDAAHRAIAKRMQEVGFAGKFGSSKSPANFVVYRRRTADGL
ncbi:hypothetical protein SAMN04487788_2627 [Microbacterium testaceum StLB037]|uniref:YobI-like P-loop NTPase domain-containing protein n=1 Tax=Microbacterium testaceum (strain StLB037) TaxID=979556 RepID=A0A1H0R2P7_MICTS|nr:hypothetical protein [Microbacterium testaceum]SDP23803.1 hypothetical protein SAMN04487788_2627 [Microbacterium testaceum StLB037]